MKEILITRKEMTTYSVIKCLDDKKAQELLDDPDKYKNELSMFCKPLDENWQDSDDPEFEVEELTDE